MEKKKDDSKKKGMDYAQYKEKYGVGNKRPQTGIGKNWDLFLLCHVDLQKNNSITYFYYSLIKQL